MHLPTIYYPLNNRCNFTYWVKLKTGRYCITKRATLTECVRAFLGSRAYGLTFKAQPCSNMNQLARLLLLYLFYNRLTDRKHITTQYEVILNKLSLNHGLR